MKKIILYIIIFLFSIFIVNTAGETYCAPIENGKIPEGTVGKKFNPGHYVMISDGLFQHDQVWRMAEVRKVLEYPEIDGVEVFMYWAELEESEGVYRWDKFHEILDAAAAKDKHVILSIQDRSFGTWGCQWSDNLMPQYAIDRGGVYVNEHNQCMPKLWDPNHITTYIGFLKAFGEEFDDHPNFEMFRLSETSLGYPMGGTYDNQIYYAQLIRLFEETKNEFKNTVLSLEINYGIENEDLNEFMDDSLVKYGGALSWPDPFPCRWTCDSPQSHYWARDNQGVIPIAPKADSHELYWGESDEVFDYYVGDLKASHISWVKLYGSAYVDFTREDFLDAELIPVIREKGNTINVCPSTLGNCLEVSSSCNSGNPPSVEDSNCRKINGGETIPEGFGAPYDPDNNQMNFDVSCRESNVDINVGSTNSGLFIYKYGYVWKNNNWEQISLSGNLASGSDVWISDYASTSVSGVDTSSSNYLLTYMCKWSGSEWKCGCRDQSCNQNFWNLQIAQK